MERPAPEQDDRAQDPLQGAGPIERLNLQHLLGNVGSRLSAMEQALNSRKEVDSKTTTGNLFIEATRLIFDGWTAFVFVFLILFYVPLRDVLTSIPDKVRAANEIALPGLSLKSAIEKAATSQGFSQLALTVPAPSVTRAPTVKQNDSLISYTLPEGGRGLVHVTSRPTSH